MESTQRQISVKTITGEVKVLQVGAHIPVVEFKAKVTEAFNIPVDRQRLICQGKLLKDEHLISEYVKEDGQTVHLMVRAEDVPPASNNPSVPPPNVPQPGNAPFQLDQMLASMMGNFFPGAQIFSSGQVPPPFNVPQPNAPNPQVHRVSGASVSFQIPPPSSNPNPVNPSNINNAPNPQNVSNLPPVNNPNNQGPPRNAVEIALPFDHVHNIGLILNDLQGPNTNFPPPRMPQLPVQRNPLVLLCGFLYNYQFQLLRLLPFISRVADLMQRESLITDPNERAMLQQLSQRVGNALNELALATTPITSLVQQIQIGPAPGQFQLRVGSVPVSSEVRQDLSQIPQPSARPAPGPLGGPNQMPLGVPNQMPLGGPNQMPFPFPFPMPQPGGVQGQQANMLAQFMPMISQMLGGNQNMTLRELLNTLQMHDEEESLPMMEFFYNLNINEVIGFASGNWEPIERQRPAVRESLLRLMENDNLEGRMKIVHILIDYMQRQYAVPEQFAGLIPSTFSPPATMQAIGEKWLLKVVNLVMDYNGTGFAGEFKKLLELMVGNYADEMSGAIQGGLNSVLQMIQVQLQNGMSRLVPPELTGLIGGAMAGIMNTYVTRAVTTYQEWYSSNRTQEEAKEAPRTQAASLLATWQETIDRDLELPVAPQRPFSRSYLDSDVFTQTTASTVPQNLQQFFFRNLGNGFNTAGVSPIPTSAPIEVIEDFFQNFITGTRERLRNDQDYRHGRFEYLDKIRK